MASAVAIPQCSGCLGATCRLPHHESNPRPVAACSRCILQPGYHSTLLVNTTPHPRRWLLYHRGSLARGLLADQLLGRIVASRIVLLQALLIMKNIVILTARSCIAIFQKEDAYGPWRA